MPKDDGLFWVAIVGSRSVGECSCDRRQKHWPPTPDELAHREECLKVAHWLLMLKVVTRLATEHGDKLGIVSGGAKGADTLAMDAAKMQGLPKRRLKEIPVPSGPSPFGERARSRNTKIVEKAQMVIAIFGPGTRSSGTSDTVSKALAKGIPVHVWHEGRWTTS
jgi:hypothetical protein